MGILDEDVARVRDATDLVALAGEHVQLKRVGRRFMARCPFHEEKTPSFSINPEMGAYYCFGCQAKGDAITFVREIEHLDFVETVERLAQRAGITLRYDDANYSEERRRRERLHDAVAHAIDFYHERLLGSEDAGFARRYVRSRGFEGDAVRRFRLGYSPDDFEALAQHLHAEKFSRRDIVDAGLGFENRAQRVQDQFRGRLMFPIHDRGGKPVGFGGRALVDDKGPKYKNSAESAIYHKSRVLFWLHEAKSEVVARGDVIVCEGYTDVMAFVLAGYPNAVATCGTALTDEHFTSLKNLSPLITLAYDADAAGQAAAERVYEWERNSEVQVRIADLPSGADPADVWQDDPAALETAVKGATPFLQFRLDRLLAAADRATIEGRARAAERGAALVAEHPSDLVRDQYAMTLATTLQLDPDRVRAAIGRVRQRRTAGGAPTDQGPLVEPVARPVDRAELDALRWAVHAPMEIGGRLDRALFADPLALEAYDALAAAQTFPDAVASASPSVASLLERLAVEDPGDADIDDLIPRVVVNLVVASSRRTLASMLSKGDARSADLAPRIDELVVAREAGEWRVAEEIAGQLVMWIAEQHGDEG